MKFLEVMAEIERATDALKFRDPFDKAPITGLVGWGMFCNAVPRDRRPDLEFAMLQLEAALGTPDLDAALDVYRETVLELVGVVSTVRRHEWFAKRIGNLTNEIAAEARQQEVS